MRILVISDLHYKYHAVSVEDRQNQELLLRFLESCIGKYDLLVLNGDIFDLWYDWPRLIIKQYFPLLALFDRIRRAGCRIVYLSGNHDFWFGDFFETYLDAKLYEDYYVLKAKGQKIYFCHGDLHTTNDLRYQFFRAAIRLPFMRKIFGLLHPEIALAIGNGLSRSSRKRREPPGLRAKKSAGLINFADSIIKRQMADIVIMGHSHQPQIKQLQAGIYANSGDWISHHSYIEIISGQVSLKYFSIDKEKQA